MTFARMLTTLLTAARGADPVPTQPPAIEVVVEAGYHPDRVVVKQGDPVRLTFLRKEYTGCTREVVFPTLGIRRELPPNQPVEVDLGTPVVGEIPFQCGMQMIHGTVVVESRE